MILLLVFIFIPPACNMHTVSKRLSVVESYSNPYSFTYYPASVVLQNGDTINGRFTKTETCFLLIHENPDSNYQLMKGVSNVTGLSFYYKKFDTEEVNNYKVNGQEYEGRIITAIQTDRTYIPAVGQRLFMTKLTSENTALQLYRYMSANVPENFFSAVVQNIFNPADTVIGKVDYYFDFYIHFPDEHPMLVWGLTTEQSHKALKEKLITTFKECAGLEPTVEALQQMKRSGNIIGVLAMPDAVIKTRGLTAILERFQKFDSCYKAGKDKF